MRAATIALAVEVKDGVPLLLEALLDSREISILEASHCLGEGDPLIKVLKYRQQQLREDDEFSDYVESLLCRPFLKFEVQSYGIQWLKSRIRVEQFHKDELEAAAVIANYAFQVFTRETKRLDFVLAGPNAQVRIRVFVLRTSSKHAQSA